MRKFKFKKNSVVFMRGKDPISKAIVLAQNEFWKTKGKTSHFSHVGFIGSDNKFYESTVGIKVKYIEKKVLFWKIKIPVLKLIYGIKITDVDKRFKNADKTEESLAYQYDFSFSENKWDIITEKGRQMYKSKVRYGGIELFGTLWVIIKWNVLKALKKDEQAEALLKRKNPFDNPKNVYCIAFVAECMRAAGINYVSVDPSVATVDHGWYTRIKHKSVVLK